MDTSRLIINTIDKSSYDIQEETRLTGFTVVKAPKGPLTPVKIPAGGASKIQDIFGVSSKDYPEIFEVETFNKEYDVWVSAPYSENGTEVNTALITTDGIFASGYNIPYNSKIENEIFGNSDSGESLSLGDLINSDVLDNYVSVLKDYRFAKTNKLPVSDGNCKDLGDKVYPGYNTDDKALEIKTGILKTQSINGWKFRIEGLKNTFNKDFEISGNKINCNSTPVGDLKEYTDDGYTYHKIQITGATDTITSKDIISNEYVKGILDEDENRRKLSVYWLDWVSVDKVKGVIIPKYPSNRDLHISFAAFDDKINYSNKNAAGRNLLKMTVYEDGAFHNASHKLNINGSLNPSDVDSNGYPIGFTESNSSYVNQDLIFVYSVDSGFTDSDDFNLNINKYPDIVIFGGTREFYYEYIKTKDKVVITNKTYYVKTSNNTYVEVDEPKTTDISTYYEYIEDSTALHNIGWEKALEPDFSDVNIFFSSQDTTGKSINDLRTDKFFSLVDGTSDGHNLSGYIFNYSVAPSSIEGFNKNSNYLSFGRNYWNICNMAVIQLRDGSKIFSPMTGAKALMQCRIIEQRFGGVAPMWENEGNPGIGGQLDMINPVRLRYKYNKEQLDTLNSYNYNPVINDRQYGIMVVGQKTCKSGAITDWSYIGHACAFFEFIREVRANVMIPQIGKANNPYYRDLRAKQVLQYLRQRTEGDNRIWAAASVDTSTADGVNDVYARKALKFVINVSVTVDIFSEKVELNFTNEDQTSLVSYSDSTEE